MIHLRTFDSLQIRGGGENPEILTALSEPSYDESLYPVFTRALANASPAHAVQIEWLAETDGIVETWTNYQQIFRWAFNYRIDGSDLDETSQASLKELLGGIELTLTDGRPGYDRSGLHPIAFCGGVRHYLGRDLQDDDYIALRPLQLPCLLLYRGEFDATNDYVHTGEWLCETSLVVIPKGA